MTDRQIQAGRTFRASDFSQFSRDSLPSNFTDYTVPYQPDVWKVDMLRISDGGSPPNWKPLGPSTVLVGHGFNMGGNWSFKSGLKIKTALEILRNAGHHIEALAVCNPGKIELGQNKTYGLGDMKVATYLRGDQVWMDVHPANQAGSMVEKKSIIIKKKPRISIKSPSRIRFVE